MAIGFDNLVWNCYRSRYTSNPRGFEMNRWALPVELQKCGAFLRFMKVPLNADTLELPCVYKYIIGQTLLDNNTYISRGNEDKVVEDLIIPMMYLEYDAVESRSSNPALKKFFHDTDPRHNLVRKKVGNNTYYGGEGIILYEDFTPLIMFTLQVNRIQSRTRTYFYEPVKPIIRINPIIYSKDDILAKYIRTKLIANSFAVKDSSNLYSHFSQDRLKNDSGVFTKRELDWDFKIIIEDFSNFFVTPDIPDVTFNSDNINSMLSNNLDSILSELL